MIEPNWVCYHRRCSFMNWWHHMVHLPLPFLRKVVVTSIVCFKALARFHTHFFRPLMHLTSFVVSLRIGGFSPRFPQRSETSLRVAAWRPTSRRSSGSLYRPRWSPWHERIYTCHLHIFFAETSQFPTEQLFLVRGCGLYCLLLALGYFMHWSIGV